MSESKENVIKEIKSFAEVPLFNNENEDADFWANHCLSDELLETMSSLESQVNIEQSVLEKLRRLPQDKQLEVLDFTEFLYQKSRQLINE